MMRHLENHRIPDCSGVGQVTLPTLGLTKIMCSIWSCRGEAGLCWLVGRQVLHRLLVSGALAPQRYPDQIPQAAIPRVSILGTRFPKKSTYSTYSTVVEGPRGLCAVPFRSTSEFASPYSDLFTFFFTYQSTQQNSTSNIVRTYPILSR